MDQRLAPAVDWTASAALETLGIDEVALLQGQGHSVAVIGARDAQGHPHVLAVLPDRLQTTVQAFPQTILAPPESHGAVGRYRYGGGLRRGRGGGAAERPNRGGPVSCRRSLSGGGGRSA